MRTYETYKDSGLEWLGKVPEHWKVDKFKYQFELITTPSDSSNKIGLENIESTTGRFIKTDNEFEGNGIAFQPNDIVYGKLRPYLQKVWLADFAGNAVGDFYVFRCDETNSPAFIKYVLLSHNFTVEADGSTYGAKMPRVSYEFIGNLKWAMPPLPEQQTIASYLDHKVSQIDALIAEKEKMVADLKAYRSSVITEAVTKGLDKNAEMKESGVEWIGKTPQNWNVVKLKYFISISSGDALPNENIHNKGKYPVFGGGESIGFYEQSNTSSDELIVGRVGARCGCVTMPRCSCWATDNALKIRTTLLLEYIYFLLTAANLNSLNNSNAQPLITATAIKNVIVPLPPKEEQKDIASFLLCKTSKIDSNIEEIEHQLSDLKSYKSSLITEAVTGKIDLRGWEQQKE